MKIKSVAILGIAVLGVVSVLDACKKKEEATTPAVVKYKPQITDLQKEGLRGKIKTMTNESSAYEYNATGFQVKQTKVSTKEILNTKEYNTDNLLVKEVDFENGKESQNTVYTYDEFNRAFTFVGTATNGVITKGTITYSGNTTGKGLFTVDGKEVGTFTITLNDKLVKIKEEFKFTEGGGSITTYDEFEQMLVNILNKPDGSMSQTNTYNANKKLIKQVKESTTAGIKSTETFEFEYDANGDVSKLVYTQADGTKVTNTYTYELDANKNWIKQILTNSSSSTANTIVRTITYY